MNILVLGGTQFVGRHMVQALLERGHSVTTFTRGQTADSLPPEVERRHGDRSAGDLSSLQSRTWDACLDVSGYLPRVVKFQAQLGHVMTPPHITLLSPSVRPETIWVKLARAVAARHHPTVVQLGGVGTFGSRVIFLTPDAPGLRPIHDDLVRTQGQAPGQFDLDHYHPHLSVVLSWRPLSVGWTEALKLARQEFGELDTAPVHFTASELVLFRKDAPGGIYTEYAHFPLRHD